MLDACLYPNVHLLVYVKKGRNYLSQYLIPHPQLYNKFIVVYYEWQRKNGDNRQSTTSLNGVYIRSCFRIT